MVFYRKYRPQTLADLDSTAVREKLTAVLSHPDTIPHAFLFTGPKGLGKTSTARIIAKVVNCIGDVKKRGKSGIEPCNECDQCKAITNGSYMDVLEIDAASNRGIDEIRELKETIKLAPLQAKKKIYIIDEVHMLTTEAFNALLKTLEEPPSHAMFILCTTEPQKVPATILSRTFHSNFRKASKEELISAFRRIAQGEKLEITDEALDKLAMLSDGGFRDGTKLLEEIVSIAHGKKITEELIDKTYHVSGVSSLAESLCQALLDQDTKAALEVIKQGVEQGVQVRYVLEEVLSVLHAALLKKSGVADDTPDGIASQFSIRELNLLLRVFSRALVETKYAVIPQLPLELAVIELTLEDALVQTQDTQGADDVSSLHVAEGISLSSLRKEIGNVQKKKALYGEEKKAEVKKTAVPPANVSVLHFTADGEITPEYLREFWTCIIREVKQHNHTLAGVLRGCMIKSFDRKNLVIETAYSFHREKLDNANTKEILEQIAKTLTGNPVSVTVELKS